MPPFLRLGMVVLAFAALVLLGCSGQWSFSETWTFGDPHAGGDRGDRPAATATPRHNDRADSAATAPALATPTPEQSDTDASAEDTSEEPSVEAPVEAPVDAFPQASAYELLSTEEQLRRVIVPTRDVRDLALRLDPAVDEIPLVVNPHTPDYQVGERLQFWVHNLDTVDHTQITAELIHRTDVAYAWVEVGTSADRQAIIQAVDAFSNRAYPALVDFFGSEWNPGVDNDPRLHILHSSQLGQGIAGYYSSSDQYSRLANAYSNEKEMFYINVSIVTSGGNTNYYETVLAHEFQHMIHWYQDRNEDTWVNEGLSEYAPEVAGYAPDTRFAGAFARRPHTQLTTWGEDQGQNGPHYGAAYLFIRYFAQRFGGELTRRLVASPANGIHGFNEVLTSIGLGPNEGYGFDGLFADWVVANYADDPFVLPCLVPGCDQIDDPLYGHVGLQQPAPALHSRYQTYPVLAEANQLPNYATHYILLEGEGDWGFELAGPSWSPLANAPWREDEQGRAFAWWSNRGDDFNTRLTRRFDLREIEPGTPVAMLARMWWHIEADYDFGYIVASVDGEKWDVLSGDYTTTDDPAGAAFGPGYTGQSRDRIEGAEGNDSGGDDSGWVVERVDLSDYVGQEVWIRFEYVTDDAINTVGWFIDEVQIPALGYVENFQNDGGGWHSEGWIRTDNRLNQHWLLQILRLEDNRLVELERHTADSRGQIEATIAGLGNGNTAVIAISPLAPATTLHVPYTYRIEPADE